MSMRPPALDLPIMFVEAGIAAGGVAILERITLTLAAGAPTLLIGPNGAGKTTLLRAAMGLIPLTSGFVTWGGREASAPKQRAIVFQRPVMLRRSAAGNVRYALAAAGVPRAARAARTAELLQEVGLAGLAAAAGAAAVGRRAAAAGARARAGARSGRAVSRRADRQPRSRRHQGDRGHRARASPRAASRW